MPPLPPLPPQAVYRWWASEGSPGAPLALVPPAYTQLLSRVVALTLHSYQVSPVLFFPLIECRKEAFSSVFVECTSRVLCPPRCSATHQVGPIYPA